MQGTGSLWSVRIWVGLQDGMTTVGDGRQEESQTQFTTTSQKARERERCWLGFLIRGSGRQLLHSGGCSKAPPNMIASLIMSGSGDWKHAKIPFSLLAGRGRGYTGGVLLVERGCLLEDPVAL